MDNSQRWWYILSYFFKYCRCSKSKTGIYTKTYTYMRKGGQQYFYRWIELLAVCNNRCKPCVTSCRTLLIYKLSDYCVGELLHIPAKYPRRWGRVAQKTDTLCFYAVNSSNIDQFSNLFHCQNQVNSCNNTVTKYPTYQTSGVSLHYLVKCQCLKSNKWKQDDFCNNTF